MLMNGALPRGAFGGKCLLRKSLEIIIMGV
nr:MAG TPA: hypothetical protein [Caudoviricetes sp.]